VSAPIQIGARRTSADIAVQVIGRFGNLALGVVVTVVIVRTLGQRGFGQWSTIFAVTQIAANFGELGLSQIAVSRAAAEPARESDWLGALLSLRILLALPITFLSAIAVVLIAPTHATRLAGVLISLTLLLGAPASLSAVFQLRVRNDISTAILTLNSVVWAAAVLAVVATSGGIVTLAGAFVAVSALTTSVTVLAAARIIPVRLRDTRRLWGTLARVGVAVGAAGILVTGYVRLDQILVLELAGSRDAGLYGVAYRILDQVQFIPAAVMTTLFPLIASSYPRDLTRVRELFQSTAEYLTIASLPILAFTIVAARPVVTLLFGEPFAAAAPALPILMAAFVSISFGYLVGSMVVIVGLQRRFLLYAAIGLVVNAVLNVLLIPRYGFLAAAWITLLTEVIVMSLTMRSVTRKLEMRPRLGRIARTLGAAVLMGVTAWLARAGGVPLLGLVAITAVSYALGVMLLRVLSLGEIRAVLRDKGSAAPGGTAEP
jgi:O-antigen/teichoic acid export membrane protein